MRVLVISATALALIVGVLWFGICLRLRSAYNGLMSQGSVTFAVTPLDQEDRAILAAAQSNWTIEEDEDPFANGKLLQMAGLTPCVQSMVQVFTSRMPEFRWWSPSQNAAAMALTFLKLACAHPREDHTNRIQVSDDGHLALLLSSRYRLLVIKDEPEGLRTLEYCRTSAAAKPRNVPGADAAQAGASAASPAPGPAVQDRALQHELAQLQGEWLMLSHSSIPSTTPAWTRTQVRQIFEGDQVTMAWGRYAYYSEKITIDPSTTPKTIDFAMTGREHPLIKKCGIYELHGDTLKLCVGAPGTERPKEFSTNRSEGGALSIWTRAKPKAN
jgi:uncharacterized protein (TIGR03067 family)